MKFDKKLFKFNKKVTFEKQMKKKIASTNCIKNYIPIVKFFYFLLLFNHK